jgi:tyrosine-protein kinase Etk/Wzc
VKISSDLYQQFRTTSLHLQLVREGLTGNARIIDSAVLPEEAVLPKPAIMLPAAAACGLVFSLLFIFVRSGLATGVRSAREIESGTGLSVYSSAISLSTRAGRTLRGRPREVLAVSAPSDEAALGLRQLRALLQHQLRGRANNRLMFTGPTHGVGVHFIASNLAAIMATAGQRVLLIDLDRQRLHRSFGMGNAPGLTELVSGACTRKEAIRATEIAGLDLVEAGSASLQFDQLARSQAFVDLLNHASKDYDIVLLAAPPVLKSSETLSLALEAATVVLVARARKTEVDEIAQSSRRLNQAGQLLSGVVLNGV